MDFHANSNEALTAVRSLISSLNYHSFERYFEQGNKENICVVLLLPQQIPIVHSAISAICDLGIENWPEVYHSSNDNAGGLVIIIRL